jgi:hypothetical protein
MQQIASQVDSAIADPFTNLGTATSEAVNQLTPLNIRLAFRPEDGIR